MRDDPDPDVGGLRSGRLELLDRHGSHDRVHLGELGGRRAGLEGEHADLEAALDAFIRAANNL